MKPLVLTCAVLALTAAACTGNDDATTPRASFADTECPSDVAAVVFIDVTCGYLTVPENRADPGAATTRVFVVRLTPPEVAADDPVFVPGTDLGHLPNYAGIVPLAQKVRREVILMDARGVGHSEPALECPEVTELRGDAWATASDDPGMRAAFLDAVASCHDRLAASGIDLAGYNLAETAADAEDLRRELDIDEWNLSTYGTASRISFEMLHQSPDHVRSVFLDSPEMPDVDPLLGAVTGTDAALQAVLTACDEDVRCGKAFGDPQARLNAALTRLDRRPMMLEVPDPMEAGVLTQVRMDAGTFLRLLRAIMADGGSSGSMFTPSAVPAVVDLAADGRLADLAWSLQPMLSGEDPYCLGYYTKCAAHHRVTAGAAYSLLCHDIAPFHDPAEVERAAVGRPGYAQAYGDSPYRDVCDAWPVDPAESAPSTNVADVDIPILVITGPYAVIAREDAVKRGLAGHEATIVAEATSGHNMVWEKCLNAIRNTWVDPLQLSAEDLECTKSLTLDWVLDPDTLITPPPESG